ncbi:hypothetical protein [Archangium violaceum]|uniref:Uncharacterized protein n=1 Tax=Archangium violaceum Cb vi76 TaxID=1406225 RepID=A0A084SXH1_9BACT|nr:hypothetical protein [Archangium violaceum]KFA93156.1 hypothetical protein Q664_10695 [Archangium violaceum Cb vi76]
MANEQMTPALRSLVARHPPMDTERLWNEISEAAWKMPASRGEKELPGERVARLRERLHGELIAFHQRLRITPYTAGDMPCAPGCALWRVDIPLTLFPKRDQGFSRLECLVEFRTDNERTDCFRVLRLFPEERSTVQAHAEMGAALAVDMGAKVGVPLPVMPGLVLTDKVAARVYGKTELGPFIYEARRTCVETEIVEGISARWRLDDTSSPERVGVESHQLSVVLEVKQGAPPLHAAGYLEAYSDMHWLTATVGSFWQNLKQALRDFFKRGAPVEAYADWGDILASYTASAGKQAG